jgi:hypothetical protein
MQINVYANVHRRQHVQPVKNGVILHAAADVNQHVQQEDASNQRHGMELNAHACVQPSKLVHHHKYGTMPHAVANVQPVNRDQLTVAELEKYGTMQHAK